ncbi:hypothetical protein CQY20_19310 [Mycolicibacterium agri]|uniref:Uncharacterized protein n=1 Tax=Mycolicibacterium agri TaxID=36811 RepID=A0A2A7MYH9_MYCAG|nr:hypothetical protein CQY20_19310 [Mycolicibacterium agri]
MQAVGVTATVIAGIIVLAAVVLCVRSLPDLNRYMKIRRM